MNNYFPLERNRYFYGKLLTVRDFEKEQNYTRNKSRLINRVVHGAGVVCGLGVTVSDDATLMIESGMALDYQGREIVVEEPLIRKLQMLDGYEALQDQVDAYLCLSYDETDIEPVNAVGAEVAQSRQFNVTRESYRLTLTTDPPEYRSLLETLGYENVNVIYTDAELTLVLYTPAAVCAGDEFSVSVLVVKNDNTPPVQFSLEGEGTYIDSLNGKILLEYNQSSLEERNVYVADFKLKAQTLTDVSGPLLPSGAELNVELGSHHYKNYITVDVNMMLCRDEEALRTYNRKLDDLKQHMTGGDIPIYLAKLELIHSTSGTFLSDATDLPFGQSVKSDSGGRKTERENMSVSTSVQTLEYWQKPDVRAHFNSESNRLQLDFSLPSPEQYDYSISHGTVDITMPGGIRVNARYFSDEIPHGLGAGNVDVRLEVEFTDAEGDTAFLVGNSEVFKSKNLGVNPPWVEAAAVIYPERGTMRIGVWLHDTVEGNRLRIHYYAQKPERDTSRTITQDKVSISMLPEISRLSRREQLRLKATIVGSEDKGVIWKVREENGGSIDANGIYQAPETQGTYEIVATASADPKVSVSAFVIVE